MDIYEFALQMEKDGEDYYRDQALKASNKGLKHIFTFLADAEAQHYDILKKMKDSEDLQLSDADIISEVKSVFKKMKEENDTGGVDASQTEIYRKAMDLERENHKFYMKKASESKDEKQKDILLKFADEEQRHCTILENIINFVSCPGDWLENAEWYKLSEN
ncbi:MAG: ferritin family protein [Candidatus Scalindua sp.]|nr:ferritin family protein [Candidatus Scalindua sp.]MBT6563295.1 ferritin family protein [Candidatus Scalindua sp.]